MSKIKEFENIPDIDIEGEETLEEAVADCKALFGKYNKELFNGEVSLERCSEARLVLLTLAHRSHHNMEYSTACLKAELLPTSTGPNLDNLAPLVGVERLEAGKATAVIRFTLSAPRTSATGIPEGTQVRTADKRYFKTEKYAEILPGELTVDVVAVADEAGSNSDGIAEGEINVLVDPIPYVSGAKSVSASTGGTDTEGDDSFTRRINYAPSIFSVAGPVDAYEYFASSWRSDVADTKFGIIYKSITVDNGSEFALADQLEQSCITGDKRTKVYYCHPYSSWERGSNENVNGMIRRRHPKGTDFSKVTAEEIAATENWINSYPRKIFGYKSAGTMFRECLRELGLTA